MVWPSWDHTVTYPSAHNEYTVHQRLFATCFMFFQEYVEKEIYTVLCYTAPPHQHWHHAVRPTLRPVESQTTGSMVAMGKARRHPHGDRWTPMWDMVSVSTTLAWRTRRITFFTKWKPPRESHLGTPPIEDTGGATSPSSELTTPLLHPSYD